MKIMKLHGRFIIEEGKNLIRYDNDILSDVISVHAWWHAFLLPFL